MTYTLKPRGNGSFKVVRSDDETSILGFAYPCDEGYGFHVYTARSPSQPSDNLIAAVNYIIDVIPAFTTYLEQYPHNWKHGGFTDYSKFSPYGMLSVSEDRDGKWWVNRCGQCLYRRCKTGKRSIRPVTFRTPQEAQEAADKYVSNWFALC